MVNDELPPTLTLDGEKLQEEPAGIPEQVNDTEPLKPPSGVTLMVDAPEVR